MVSIDSDVNWHKARKIARPEMSGRERGASGLGVALPCARRDPRAMLRVLVAVLVLGCRRAPSEDTEGRTHTAPTADEEKPKKSAKAVKVDFSAEAGPAKPKVGATYSVTMEVTNESDEDIDGFDVQVLGAKAGFVLVSAAPTSATTEVLGGTFVGHYAHSIESGKKVGAVLNMVAKSPGNYSITILLTSRSSKIRLVDSDSKTWSLTAPVIVLP